MPFWHFVKLQGAATVRGKTITHRIELGARVITKDTLVEILSSFQHEFFVVLDEFDRLGQATGAVREQIGDLIKDLADNDANHKCKLVVCGVGRGARDLFQGHPSIPRQIREVPVRPLRRSSIKGFLEKAASLVGMEFEAGVLEVITVETGGFPYAVHLVALESCRAAKREESRKLVTLADLEEGRMRAIGFAYHDYLERYREKIKTLNDSETAIIRFINVVRTNWIEPMAVRQHMRQTGRLDEAGFDVSWDGLVKRCEILYEHPSRPGKYAFTNPLLRPFLRMQSGSAERAGTTIRVSRDQGVLDLDA